MAIQNSIIVPPVTKSGTSPTGSNIYGRVESYWLPESDETDSRFIGSATFTNADVRMVNYDGKFTPGYGGVTLTASQAWPNWSSTKPARDTYLYYTAFIRWYVGDQLMGTSRQQQQYDRVYYDSMPMSITIYCPYFSTTGSAPTYTPPENNRNYVPTWTDGNPYLDISCVVMLYWSYYPGNRLYDAPQALPSNQTRVYVLPYVSASPFINTDTIDFNTTPTVNYGLANTTIGNTSFTNMDLRVWDSAGTLLESRAASTNRTFTLPEAREALIQPATSLSGTITLCCGATRATISTSKYPFSTTINDGDTTYAVTSSSIVITPNQSSDYYTDSYKNYLGSTYKQMNANAKSTRVPTPQFVIRKYYKHTIPQAFIGNQDDYLVLEVIDNTQYSSLKDRSFAINEAVLNPVVDNYAMGLYRILPTQVTLYSEGSQCVFRVTVRDQRGRSGTATATIYQGDTSTTISSLYSFLYTPSHIQLSAYRSDSSGTPNSSSGTCIRCLLAYSQSKYNSLPTTATNRIVLTVIDNTTQQVVNTYNYDGLNADGSYTRIITGKAINKSYTVRAQFTDYQGEVVYSSDLWIPSGEVFMDFRQGGQGLGIGMRAEDQSQVDVAWATKFFSGVNVAGVLTGPTIADLYSRVGSSITIPAQSVTFDNPKPGLYSNGNWRTIYIPLSHNYSGSLVIAFYSYSSFSGTQTIDLPQTRDTTMPGIGYAQAGTSSSERARFYSSYQMQLTSTANTAGYAVMVYFTTAVPTATTTIEIPSQTIDASADGVADGNSVRY